jgi:PadR family transcriptional regulator
MTWRPSIKTRPPPNRTNPQLPSYNGFMRRKPGALIPIEVDILEAAILLRSRGQDDFYGYLIASEIQSRTGAKLLTSHGTLYKALARMKDRGWLSSAWEDPEIAAREERPRRRLYSVTPLGESAYEGARALTRDAMPGSPRGLQPS